MQKKFWQPSVTSQFKICCIPFHLDTYRGCVHDCKFCFARDLTTFARRKSQHKEFEYLICNDSNKFKKWVDRTSLKDIDYTKVNQVAFKQRMPIKIGATSDPFPYIEKDKKITYQFLKILKGIDYPVQISTKNPQVFQSYCEQFIGANIVLNVSFSVMTNELANKIQPGAISVTRRLESIKRLTEKGFNVLVRLQPFIYPYCLQNAEDIVKKIKNSGAFGFETQGYNTVA